MPNVEHGEGFEPFDLFLTVSRVTRAGKQVLRFLTPGVHFLTDQMRHEGLSSHGHHDAEPEDTLASPAQLFTPDWAIEARSTVVPFDSEGNYHNPDGESVA